MGDIEQGRDDNDKWADIKKDGGIQFTPEEQWGEVEAVKPPMNWPQAIASTVSVLAISAVLIVLFLVLWGPW